MQITLPISAIKCKNTVDSWHRFKVCNTLLPLLFCTGVQKGLKSDFDMAYERGRISVSAEEGNTPPTFTRVSTLKSLKQIKLTLLIP